MTQITYDKIEVGETKNDSPSPVSNLSDEDIISEHFRNQESFLSELFSTAISNDTQYHYEEIAIKKGFSDFHYISEPKSGFALKPWKNVENISSRVVEFCDAHVIMECLVDKENGIYEERKFPPNLFDGCKILTGQLFLLRIYTRENEIKIQIHDDPKLTLEKDFPKVQLSDKYKDSKLFKR